MSSTRAICCHCHRLRYIQSAHLCCNCARKPAVRCLYPPAQERHRLRSEPPEPVRAPEPTCAPPGSPGKVQVLEQRLWEREFLWHPLDADMGGCNCD